MLSCAANYSPGAALSNNLDSEMAASSKRVANRATTSRQNIDRLLKLKRTPQFTEAEITRSKRITASAML